MRSGWQTDALDIEISLRGEPMKVNMQQFNGYLAALSNGDEAAQREAISGLAKYSDSEWEGSPEAVGTAVAALIGTRRG